MIEQSTVETGEAPESISARKTTAVPIITPAPDSVKACESTEYIVKGAGVSLDVVPCNPAPTERER
jgi:hypothetical protein